MKKIMTIIAVALAIAYSMPSSAQVIERKVDDNEGTTYMTNAISLFSGCKLRMCRYDYKDGKKVYGIALDLTNRVDHVCKGNMLTIHFKDGNRITLSNLYDTKADVHHEHTVTTVDTYHTEFIPIYSRWYDAFFTMPVERRTTEAVPVDRTTSFASLYYIVTKEQIDMIMSGNVKDMSIVTDNETIVKKARPLSKAVSELFPAVEK